MYIILVYTYIHAEKEGLREDVANSDVVHNMHYADMLDGTFDLTVEWRTPKVDIIHSTTKCSAGKDSSLDEMRVHAFS